MLGFRVDPMERLQEAVKEIQSLHRVYSVCPIFGIEFEIEDKVRTLYLLSPIHICLFFTCVHKNRGTNGSPK